MSRINDIINDFKAGKITREEANAQLKAEGAGFTLDPEQNPGGWTQEEWEQGFIPAKEGEPWWAPMHTFTGAVRWQDELERYIPEKEMVYNRPKYHGVTVVKGGLRPRRSGSRDSFPPRRASPGGRPCTPLPALFAGRTSWNGTSPRRRWSIIGLSTTA